MRISSRGIIIQNGKVLTMFRRKIKDGNTKEYYVIPGGGLEDGETLEQNVVRELKEEMNVDIKILGYLGQDDQTGSNYFHCQITNGTPKLGGEELDRMTNDNYYEPLFVNIDNLQNIDIYGREFIFKALNCDYVQK